MPRNKNNPQEFIAGALPIVKIKDKEYFVDGRLQELRNVNDFSDKIGDYEIKMGGMDWLAAMTKADFLIVCFEFYGT